MGSGLTLSGLDASCGAMVPEGFTEGSDSTELAEVQVRQCLGSSTVENNPGGYGMMDRRGDRLLKTALVEPHERRE
jgi:hypothetical protein